VQIAIHSKSCATSSNFSIYKLMLMISSNSRYVNVALQMENTRQQAATMMSKANGALNKISFDDSSALLKAAMVGQTRVVRELLDQPGIDIDFRDPKSHGQTALHYACYNGHLGVVKLLVEHGASLEVTDKKGMTPFLEAADAESLDVVKYMEENGSDINVVTGDGRTILHVSAAGNSVSNLEHLLQSPRLTHLLSSRSKNGRTVLLCAVQAGSVETARFILQRSSRSDVLSKTDDGHTCLHYAAISGKLKMFSLFQDTGICHHDQTSEGFTALHYAAKSSKVEVSLFRALLDHIDRVTVTSHLFTYPTLIDPRAIVQRSTGTWTVDDFVSGRRLDVSTSFGTMSKTALQLLLSADPFTSGHPYMIRDIISRVGLDLERRDREKKTPLIVLASRLSSESGNGNLLTGMKQLLDRGVDPDTQDVSGRTALHYLCDSNTFSLWIFQAIVHLIGADGR
jgi:ankyrin repeat protein